ncbi:ATP-binding protein [Cupriavidus basilensis]|uniref:histidine kinase n=1 Tax=Cupriavidus basilensis TaxID=68895 RepID=A0ABT6AIZ4_9BURK|nr:ATP-binding protein [Cupriavidus basilensis]MDF3832576.1 ATP-binding protein [Cupriavidus basilensis]
MRSLRMRLFAALMVILLGFWIGWHLIAGFRLYDTDTGWWDVSLSDAGGQILRALPPALDPATLATHAPLLQPFDDAVLSYQVWVDGRRVLRSPTAPEAPLRPSFTDGAGREDVGGVTWWVHAVSDPARHVQVQVGRRQDAVAHDVRSLTLFSLINSVLIVAILSAATWAVVRWSLAPVRRILATLAGRSPLDLTPLPLTGLPKEISPLVGAFNRLLSRTERAVQGERRFIADAAHELRTPLAALSIHAHVALHASDDAQRASALRQLASGVARCARLSEQLLDLARLEAMHNGDTHTPLDLAQLVAMVLADFEVLARQRGQSLALRLEPCLVRGDLDALGILLRNLVDNALRFSPDGGHAAVSCSPEPAGAGPAMVRLTVADNGPGVPATEQERIFDAFYRVAGSGQRGSGIGLSLVARIARNHGARIETGPGLGGGGLAVSVLLPAAEEAPDRA